MKSPCKFLQNETQLSHRQSCSCCAKQKKENSHESTPSPSIERGIFFRITPEGKRCRHIVVNGNTPLHRIREGGNRCMTESISFPKNPFDEKAETLYFSSCSPSVFAAITQKKEEEGNFRWSIEQLSTLFPADIDETSQQDNWTDVEHEVNAQKAIDAFFSQDHIVPSPWSPTTQGTAAAKLKCRLRKSTNSEGEHQKIDVPTQTTLSIPPDVDLTNILGDFFTYNDDQEASNSREHSRLESDALSSSSLRRKLFVCDEDSNCPLTKSDNSDLTQNRVGRLATSDVEMCSFHSTRTSDLFSSSPITPYNCSGAAHFLSSSTPPVSPIAYLQKTPKSVPKSQSSDKKNYQEHLNEFTEDSSHHMSIAPENSTATEEASCSGFQLNKLQSDVQDTGYLTGSMNSAQSMISTEAVSRVLPVSDLMSDYAISKQNCSDFHMSVIDESLQISICSKLCNDQMTSGIENCSWIPNECSTPSKSMKASS